MDGRVGGRRRGGSVGVLSWIDERRRWRLVQGGRGGRGGLLGLLLSKLLLLVSNAFLELPLLLQFGSDRIED